MKVKIVNKSKNPAPYKATKGAAGYDICADINAPVVLYPKEWQLIPTGISIELPPGYEAQIRSRSGLAFKHGVVVLNSPGTIDSVYRGEIKILLINHGEKMYTIQPGDRVAQIVFAKCEDVDFEEMVLVESLRGEEGFGSTGVQAPMDIKEFIKVNNN